MRPIDVALAKAARWPIWFCLLSLQGVFFESKAQFSDQSQCCLNFFTACSRCNLVRPLNLTLTQPLHDLLSIFTQAHQFSPLMVRIRDELHHPRFLHVVSQSLDTLARHAHITGYLGNRKGTIHNRTQDLPTGAGQIKRFGQVVPCAQKPSVKPESLQDQFCEDFAGSRMRFHMTMGQHRD
jgi:hypothetical protein